MIFGLTGSEAGKERGVGPLEGGDSQQKAAGGKGAKPAWERRIGSRWWLLLFGKQRVTTTTKREELREWKCGNQGCLWE